MPIRQFNWVDLLAVTLLIRTGYIGFRLGLSAEFVKLAGLMGGFFVGFRYHQGVGAWVAQRSFLTPEWATALAMAAFLTGGYFLLTRLLRLLEKVVQVTFEQRVNRIGGLGAGLARGVVTASAIFVTCGQLPSAYLNASIQERSVSGSFIRRVAPAVYGATVPWLSQLVSAFRGGGPK